MPVYNESRFINDFLSSILTSGYNDCNDLELIMIDDNSSDESLCLLKEWQNLFSNFKLLKSELKRGPAHSRNLGLTYARGDYVSFVDCDCIVDINWLTAIRSNIFHMKRTGIAAIGGKILPLFQSDNVFQKRISRFPLHKPRKRNDDIIDLPFGNVIVVLSKLQEIGLLNSSLYYGEDTDVFYRLIENGAVLDYDKSMSIYHQVPESFYKLIRKQYHYGYSFALFAKQCGKISFQTLFGHNIFESILLPLALMSIVIFSVVLHIELMLILMSAFVFQIAFCVRLLTFRKIIKKHDQFITKCWLTFYYLCISYAYQFGCAMGGMYGCFKPHFVR